MKNKPLGSGLLFETSWEVCNKVGGIYTVLTTKAKILSEHYGDHLVFIGPDFPDSDKKENPDFISDPSLLKKYQSSKHVPEGLAVRVGRWNIPSQPIVILVDFRSEYQHLADVYTDIWNAYGVDSLHAYGDYDEGCAFAISVAKVIQGVVEHLKKSPSEVTAHFNEWATGMGLLYLQHNMPQAATLFTTHATSIGRSICSNGKPLYDYFEGYHGDQMAGELNMESKHSLEKHAAWAADCFTTVSEVTARECEQLLDIRPQVVTPNGFEDDFVPQTRAYASRRKAGRERILDVAGKLMKRSFPDDTFIIATSGRNEFRNKGINLYIDAMDMLRREIPESASDVLALILVPAWCGDVVKEGETDFMTHHLYNEHEDLIYHRLSEIGNNGSEARVSLLFVPCYLNGKDGVIDISYYDLLPAIDLTVFPSYYEPWGYTPLESVAFGVPTVTTDKAGFGQWIIDNFENSFASCGVKVVERGDSDYWIAVSKVVKDVISMLLANDNMRKKVRKAARTTAKAADWKLFIERYFEAFDIADRRRRERANLD